jgi:uncharacterized protein (TIGR00730 family)
MKRICVFCGSASGSRPAYAASAREFGALLAARGLELVYGGGHVGMMGILADSALAAGGRVIGVIPRSMVEKELAHESVTQMHIVETMHQRKALMAELSDAFVALPGGSGTLDELFEILTWRQLRYHAKPIGLLNVEGYYDPLLAWLERAFAEGFIKEKYRGLLTVAQDGAALLDVLASVEA